MKRSIRINGIDKEIELGTVVSIKSSQNMIYLEEMKNGKWRLLYNENMIPDFSKVKSLEIIRED